jgi:hypothetical protein
MKFKLTSQCGQFKSHDVAKMEALGFRMRPIEEGRYGETHEIIPEERWIEFDSLQDLLAFTSKAGPVLVFGIAGPEEPPGNSLQQGDELQIHVANDLLDAHFEY